MTTQDRTYNGWSNYETWLVNLWLQNDADSYEEVRAEVIDADSLSDAKEILKGWLDNEVEFYLEPTSGLIHDLLQGAIQKVDWYEIVRNWRNEE